MSRPKCPLQRDYVGIFHACIDSRAVNDKGVYHQHVGKFPHNGLARHDYLSGEGWWTMVVGGRDDGGRVYPCRHEGGVLNYLLRRLNHMVTDWEGRG